MYRGREKNDLLAEFGPRDENPALSPKNRLMEKKRVFFTPKSAFRGKAGGGSACTRRGGYLFIYESYGEGRLSVKPQLATP